MCLESELAESRSNFDGGMLNCFYIQFCFEKIYIFSKKDIYFKQGVKEKGRSYKF